jgi:hypothetical protein
MVFSALANPPHNFADAEWIKPDTQICASPCDLCTLMRAGLGCGLLIRASNPHSPMELTKLAPRRDFRLRSPRQTLKA